MIQTATQTPNTHHTVILKEPQATEGSHGILRFAQDDRQAVNPDQHLPLPDFSPVDFTGKSGTRKKIAQNELIDRGAKRSRGQRRWTAGQRQAAAIRARENRPWAHATGPRTLAGKAKSCANAWTGGDPMRDVNAALALQSRYVRHVQTRGYCPQKLEIEGHVASQRLTAILRLELAKNRRKRHMLQNEIISDLRTMAGTPILGPMQHTLKAPVDMNGIGLHSGKTVNLRLRPAAIDHGIIFKRTDMEEGTNLIPAKHDRVIDTRLCTLISNEHGAKVGTIEHLMAALRGMGIDNVLVELDAGEVPVMDGSSKPFIDAIDTVGLAAQSAPRRAIKILKEIIVKDGDKMVRLSPSNVPLFAGRIEFAHADIGTQDFTLKLVNGNFRHDVSDCRTFGFLKEAEMLRAAGLGLGGSLENAIILDDQGVMNPEGLRCSDEFIRHKILDAVGDLYLAGGPILGAYEGFKAGHALNNAILHALFADPSNWAPVDMYVDIAETEAAIYTPMGGTAPISVH